jgi:hypothetical protein
VIPLTAQNIAFIAKTGSLQLGSTALQVTEYAVAGIVIAVVAGVLFWQFTAWGHRKVTRFMAEARQPGEDTDELDVPEWMKDSRG